MGRKKPPDVVLVLDFGGSVTKGLYADKELNLHLLCMEPEVISIPRTSIDSYEDVKLGSADPSDAAWVSVGDACYAVGYLARSRFNANAGLSSLKYERAFPKTLAAVWVAAQQLKLKSKFSVALAILLPSGEYESGKRLHEMLTDGLASFQTPTGTMNVNLFSFVCKPEGGGIYMMHRARLGDAAKRKSIAVVMVGYRNASILVSERGQVTKRVTSELGFIRLVELVQGRVASNVPTARLATAIARAGDKADSRFLSPLAASGTYEFRKEEVQKLISSINSCRIEYASALCSWLREVIPRQLSLDEVVLSGGTAEYMKPELESHFAYTDINWNAGIVLPEHLREHELGSRLCDAFGMYTYFCGIVAESIGA